MRNSQLSHSGTRSPLSPTRGLNFSISSMGSGTKNQFNMTSKSQGNMSTFSTQIHQIRCNNPGHQSKQIQFVCMAKECNQDSRLVCIKCYQGQHNIHQKQMIKVQEIFDNIDDQNIQNWPLEEHEFDAFFDGLQDQLLKRIEQLKKSLILDVNTFYLRGEGKEKKKFLEQLKKLYADAYDFTDLQDIIKKFFLREITYDTFSTGINYFLSDKEKIINQNKLYSYFAKNMQNENITDSSIVQARIDSNNLKNIQKQMLDGLNRFKTCLNVAQIQPMNIDELPLSPTMANSKFNGSFLTSSNNNNSYGLNNNNNNNSNNGQNMNNSNIKGQESYGQIQEILNYMNQQTQQFSDRDSLLYKKETYADNSKYEGFFLNGQRHIIGTRYYSDGNIYLGHWDRGLKAGNGIMHFVKGSVYQGEWFNDKKHGQAVEVYPNNSRYEGQFEDGLKHGYGRFTYQDGKVFEGIYVQDKRNGIGKLIYKNNSSEQVYHVMGERVTEEKYEQYLQQGGYNTMSQMKSSIQESQQNNQLYQDSSQTNNTFNNNNGLNNNNNAHV